MVVGLTTKVPSTIDCVSMTLPRCAHLSFTLTPSAAFLYHGDMHTNGGIFGVHFVDEYLIYSDNNCLLLFFNSRRLQLKKE